MCWFFIFTQKTKIIGLKPSVLSDLPKARKSEEYPLRSAFCSFESRKKFVRNRIGCRTRCSVLRTWDENLDRFGIVLKKLRFIDRLLPMTESLLENYLFLYYRQVLFSNVILNDIQMHSKSTWIEVVWKFPNISIWWFIITFRYNVGKFYIGDSDYFPLKNRIQRGFFYASLFELVVPLIKDIVSIQGWNMRFISVRQL